MSLRTHVILHNASSRLHCCVSKSDKADQSFLSAERSSVVVTVVRFDRCAAWRSTSALRNTV